MKKINFLLAFILLFGFVVNHKASGQNGCEVCVSPRPMFSYELNFSIPGCCDDARAVFCYECGGVTHPQIFIQVVDITYCPEPPGCDDLMWDYVRNWALNNLTRLCGLILCDTDSVEVYYTTPLCANVEWNGYLMRLRFWGRPSPDSCDYRCTEVFKICTNYDTIPPRLEKRRLDHYTTGKGGCPVIDYITLQDFGFEPNKYWRLDCVRLLRRNIWFG